jgi:hypothetical protein
MRPSEVPQEWVEAGATVLADDAFPGYVSLVQGDYWEIRSAHVLAALIPRIRAAALRDHAADAYKIDRTAPEAINAWLLRMARMEEQK